MMRFIEENDFDRRKVMLFGTSGGGKGEELDHMRKALKSKDADIEESFCCKGQTFWIINRGRPNAEDLKRARKFARKNSRK